MPEATANLEQTLPGGMKLVWVTDNGTFTKATVDSAWINVAKGIVLTGLILFFGAEKLDVEPKIDDVAVLDFVCFAFEPYRAFFTGIHEGSGIH